MTNKALLPFIINSLDKETVLIFPVEGSNTFNGFPVAFLRFPRIDTVISSCVLLINK